MELRFESVRSDWYSANTLVPRLFIKALCTRAELELVGFPAQWIPVCVHYGVAYSKPRGPLSYVPLFSDLSFAELGRLAASAKANHASRSLLEAVAAVDPVIADFVYIVDHKLAAAGYVDPGSGGTNLLNTWHSFGRPEIISLQEEMAHFAVAGDKALLLPCSRKRPYGESRTHARLQQQLTSGGYDASNFSRVVVTALGVVPEAYWRHPLVVTYDAGAVDLWRVFQLLQLFFVTNRFAGIVDCLSFKPYSNMLDMLHQLAIISNPVRPIKMRWRGFHVNLK